MRRWSALLVLLLLPSVAAWSDDAGDHELGTHVITLEGEETIVWRPASEGGFYPHADLLRFDVTETQEEIVVDVEFAAEEGAPQDPQEFFGILAIMEFRLHGFDMVGAMQWLTDDDFEEFSGFLLGAADPEEWLGINILTYAPAEVDGPRLTATIPKTHFRTPDFQPLREGDVLEDVTVRVEPMPFGFSRIPLADLCLQAGTNSNVGARGSCRWNVRDHVGDEGSEGDVPIELAPTGVDHLLLRAEMPFRLSNGLATTYLFNLTLHNFDDAPDDVALSAVGVPKGWTVLHPARVSFDGAGTQTVPVAVTVPFVHQHGVTDLFTLQGISERDTSVGVETTLGVVFADPPQPAGHHDTLWFHASEERWGAWMNAWEDDPDGGADVAEPNYVYTSGDGGVVGWNVYLSPGLLIGLDFLVGEPVEVTAVLESPVDDTVDVEATLYLMNDDGWTALTERTVVQAAMTAGTPTEVSLSMPVLEVADRIPPSSGNILLQLETLSTVPYLFFIGGTDPYVALHMEGSSMRMPLLDFHDEVDLEGISLNVFNIEGGETFKHVNPGRSAAFVFNVTNRLLEQDTLDWSLGGDRAEWATVEPASTVVPGEGHGRVVVRVQVPQDATAEDAAELLLVGTSRTDETRQVFARITALVDLDNDIPDEADRALSLSADVQQENERLGHDSPVGAWLGVAAVGAAVVAARRRA